jgi:hypothetical protein
MISSNKEAFKIVWPGLLNISIYIINPKRDDYPKTGF